MIGGFNLGDTPNRRKIAKILRQADSWIESGTNLSTEQRFIRYRAGMFAWFQVRLGNRLNEACRAYWHHIHWDNRSILLWRSKRRNRKTWVQGVRWSGSEQQWHPIPDDLFRRLYVYRDRIHADGKGPIFRTLRGRPCADEESRVLSMKRVLQRDWKLLLEAANVPHVRVHAARHEFALAVARQTHDPFLVKQAIGVKSIQTAQMYVEYATSSVRTAMNRVRYQALPTTLVDTVRSIFHRMKNGTTVSPLRPAKANTRGHTSSRTAA